MGPSSPPFKVGIVGYGLSAKIFHIPFIFAPTTKSLYILHAIVQRTPNATNDPAKDHPGVAVYKSTEELFSDKDVDMVIITTPPEGHFELAKQAISAGKHVVVEKPFTPASLDARELCKLAKAHHVLLTVYQNRRFDADFLLLSSLLRSDRLGRVAEFETHFDRHRPHPGDSSVWKNRPAPGTGATYDLGSHLMDQVVCLFGLPKRITGFVGGQRVGGDPEFEDSCTVLMHYESMLVTVKAGVVSPEVEQLRYWVRGEKGSFKKYWLDAQEDQLRAGQRPGGQGYGVEEEGKYGVLTTVGDGGKFSREVLKTPDGDYSVFYGKFAQALQNGDEKMVPVDPQVAADVIRLVELARESSKLGRTLDV